MGLIRAFILGAMTTYGIQYITKKRADGTSILGDFVEDPSGYVNRAKNYAVDKAIETAKSKVGI